MPELLEVEDYRRLAASTAGRAVDRVVAPDAWYLKGGITASDLDAALCGRTVRRARRRGKLLLLDLGSGPRSRRTDVVLGLRFGMTGRLIVDGVAAVEQLEYSSARDEPSWDRFGLAFAGGGSLVIRDPRRLGGVELEPDEAALGPDAASVDVSDLAGALSGSAAPLKARLMDQRRLAGLGNLLTDEVLWRARLAPDRPAASLAAGEVDRLARTIREVVGDLGRRGGSHTGDLQGARHRQGACPRCGAPVAVSRVGGRTTYRCPVEQR